MTSQEASGSFMLVSDVIRYFNANEFSLEGFWKLIVDIDSLAFLPTSVVSERMTEQEWRVMQSEVTTHVFGIKSIFTQNLPEVKLKDGISFGSDSAEEKAMFEWSCGGYED